MNRFKVLILCFFLAVLTILPGIQARVKEVSDETKELIQDIHVLNLINSLNLSSGQMQALLAKASEAKQAHESLINTLKSKEPEFQLALTDLRAELLRTSDPSPEVERKYHAVHGDIGKAKDAYEEKMKSLLGQVKQILNDNQLILASEYSPCLIPKRDVRNPERIGQASGISHIEDMLTRMREVPEDRFEKMRQRFTERVKNALKKHYSDEQVPKKLAEIEAAINQARGMPDQEFQVKKSQLAEKIAPPKHSARKGKELDLMLARHLLGPNMSALLQQKMATAQK